MGLARSQNQQLRDRNAEKGTSRTANMSRPAVVPSSYAQNRAAGYPGTNNAQQQFSNAFQSQTPNNLNSSSPVQEPTKTSADPVIGSTDAVIQNIQDIQNSVIQNCDEIKPILKTGKSQTVKSQSKKSSSTNLNSKKRDLNSKKNSGKNNKNSNNFEEVVSKKRIPTCWRKLPLVLKLVLLIGGGLCLIASIVIPTVTVYYRNERIKNEQKARANRGNDVMIGGGIPGGGGGGSGGGSQQTKNMGTQFLAQNGGIVNQNVLVESGSLESGSLQGNLLGSAANSKEPGVKEPMLKTQPSLLSKSNSNSSNSTESDTASDAGSDKSKEDDIKSNNGDDGNSSSKKSWRAKADSWLGKVAGTTDSWVGKAAWTTAAAVAGSTVAGLTARWVQQRRNGPDSGNGHSGPGSGPDSGNGDDGIRDTNSKPEKESQKNGASQQGSLLVPTQGSEVLVGDSDDAQLEEDWEEEYDSPVESPATDKSSTAAKISFTENYDQGDYQGDKSQEETEDKSQEERQDKSQKTKAEGGREVEKVGDAQMKNENVVGGEQKKGEKPLENASPKSKERASSDSTGNVDLGQVRKQQAEVNEPATREAEAPARQEAEAAATASREAEAAAAREAEPAAHQQAQPQSKDEANERTEEQKGQGELPKAATQGEEQAPEQPTQRDQQEQVKQQSQAQVKQQSQDQTDTALTVAETQVTETKPGNIVDNFLQIVPKLLKVFPQFNCAGEPTSPRTNRNSGNAKVDSAMPGSEPGSTSPQLLK